MNFKGVLILMESKYRNILSFVSKQELFELASELIKIPSYSGLEKQEDEIAAYMHDYLKKEGIEVSLIEVIKYRPNLIAKIKGLKERPSLMLTGHSDTVPPYGMNKNSFSGEISGGKLYGRGSCDMKGALACMIMSLVSIKRSGYNLKGDLYFAAVINEELKSEGTEHIVKNGPKTNTAIVGEPTALEIAVGHRGLEWIKITVIGKTTHGGTPQSGVNAISKAAKLINRIEEELIPKFKERNHPILGEPSLNFGVIKGGDQPSSVAGKCVIQIDRRWIPGESLKQVYDELNDLIQKMKNEDKDFNAEIKPYFENSKMMVHKYMEIDSKHLIIKDLSSSIEKILNRKSKIVSFPAWTDAALLSNYANIPSVIFGPGNLKNAHSENEFIELEQLYNAYKIYTLTSLKYCG